MIDLTYALAGALIGFIVGLTGVGGGALMTPILLIFFDVTPTVAVATDLWFAAITKMVGARVHYSSGNVDWMAVKRLWLGSLPVALLVVCVVSLGAQTTKVNWLSSAIGIILIFTAFGMLIAPKLLIYARGHRVSQPELFKAIQPLLTVISGAVLGVSVALTSVGAGALGSVMLLYLYPLRMTPHRLVASDIVHAIPLAMVAGIGYLFVGLVNWWMLASLLVGSIPSVVLGSLLAGRLHGRWIQIALSVMLITAGIKVLI